MALLTHYNKLNSIYLYELLINIHLTSITDRSSFSVIMKHQELIKLIADLITTQVNNKRIKNCLPPFPCDIIIHPMTPGREDLFTVYLLGSQIPAQVSLGHDYKNWLMSFGFRFPLLGFGDRE